MASTTGMCDASNLLSNENALILSSVSTAVNLYNLGRRLYTQFFGGDGTSELECSRLFDPELYDGRNALQYAVYEIVQEGHLKGKRILACK